MTPPFIVKDGAFLVTSSGAWASECPQVGCDDLGCCVLDNVTPNNSKVVNIPYVEQGFEAPNPVVCALAGSLFLRYTELAPNEFVEVNVPNYSLPADVFMQFNAGTPTCANQIQFVRGPSPVSALTNIGTRTYTLEVTWTIRAAFNSLKHSVEFILRQAGSDPTIPIFANFPFAAGLGTNCSYPYYAWARQFGGEGTINGSWGPCNIQNMGTSGSVSQAPGLGAAARDWNINLNANLQRLNGEPYSLQHCPNLADSLRLAECGAPAQVSQASEGDCGCGCGGNCG